MNQHLPGWESSPVTGWKMLFTNITSYLMISRGPLQTHVWWCLVPSESWTLCTAIHPASCSQITTAAMVLLMKLSLHMRHVEMSLSEVFTSWYFTPLQLVSCTFPMISIIANNTPNFKAIQSNDRAIVEYTNAWMHIMSLLCRYNQLWFSLLKKTSRIVVYVYHLYIQTLAYSLLFYRCTLI